MAQQSEMKFWKFDISRQVFYRSKLSYGLVNLMPIVPDVLVIPRRIAPRLTELTSEEVADLFLSAQVIGRVIEKEFGATSLTVACQDGAEAGQSVPHTHIHILPRKKSDFEPKDKVYDVLDEEGAKGSVAELALRQTAKLKMDSDRKPRSEDEMEKEAKWLAQFFTSDHNHTS